MKFTFLLYNFALQDSGVVFDDFNLATTVIAKQPINNLETQNYCHGSDVWSR